MKPNMKLIYAGLLLNSIGGFSKYFLQLPDFISFFCLGASIGLILLSLFTGSKFVKAITEKKKKFFQKQR